MWLELYHDDRVQWTFRKDAFKISWIFIEFKIKNKDNLLSRILELKQKFNSLLQLLVSFFIKYVFLFYYFLIKINITYI